MKISLFSFVTALAALALLAPAAATAQSVGQMTENTTFDISAETFAPMDLIPGSLQPELFPDHGALFFGPSKGQFVYEPEELYIGFDKVVFRAIQSDTRITVLVELQLRILPATLPTSGAFDSTGLGALGLYHQEETTLELCDPWLGEKEDLKCTPWSVPQAVPGWLPVQGDWDGDGWQLPSLFDPTTGTLHHLTKDPKALVLHIESSHWIPRSTWTWPIAGDWDGNGLDELLLVSDSGNISQVHGLEGDPWLTQWEKSLIVPTDGSIPWPFRRELDSPPYSNAVAVYDFAGHSVSWVALEHGSPIRGSYTMSREGGRQLPIWAAPAFLFEPPDLYFLEHRFKGSDLVLVFDHWAYGGPSTLPVKFPHEPPGI